jgi:Uma2 family endonuclease
MARLPDVEDDMPILYEDDEEGDLGESNPHVVNEEIFRHGVKAHLSGKRKYQVFSNMNLYYSAEHPSAYVSPDTMVVTPFTELPDDVTSYRIGEDGPAPVLTSEVLSERSAQQRDLDGKAGKIKVYARLGVKEYVLIDISGRFLPQRLLLKRLQPDGTWKDEQNDDGSITSELGFRLIIDTDGQLRVLNEATGEGYARPDEAQAKALALRQAEARIRAVEEARSKAEERAREAEERTRVLEAELERMRSAQSRPENT